MYIKAVREGSNIFFTKTNIRPYMKAKIIYYKILFTEYKNIE